ncbi:unnamed protein product [Hydatigera taeniaeformis]|uniref:Uncharacterized protein n=1 Tax=Hydatigena taeniaeformis TaxID=6205 RepID=A0A0R3X508_HYDTA|nr:unnamed protein product [Hydatigera taeniaeformis]
MEVRASVFDFLSFLCHSSANLHFHCCYCLFACH